MFSAPLSGEEELVRSTNMGTAWCWEEELLPGVPSVHGHSAPSSWDHSQVRAELCKVSLEPLECVLLPP